MSSNNVDNRVVNMQFNNAQFEAGVKQTLASLEELKESLKFNTSLTGINTLSNAISTFSVANIASQVDDLADRFSTLGIVGMTAIQNITNKVMDFATSKVSSTLGQITSGGWNRASSIAQSRFTLEGLLNDAEKVETAFTSASNAVDGTAYSLDSAVSAASQLAASGIDVGQDMEDTLKAIAGTAAMTGDSFDSVANIFTTVAGNGRLMGMQLTQLSSHGLNAAATIANYLGTTEAEVRDMVSHGEISFETFSDAMQSAFGEHAKDANKTFSGSMDNIKSALSRIGAIFSSGIIENDDLIDTLNDVRLTINKIKEAMLPLEDKFKDMVSAVSRLASTLIKGLDLSGINGFVDAIGTGMEYVTKIADKWSGFNETLKESVLGEVAEDAEAVSDAITASTENIEKAWDIWNNAKYGVGAARQEALGDDYDEVQYLVNQIAAGVTDLENVDVSAAHATEEAVEEATEAVEEAGDTVEEVAGKANPLVEVGKAFGAFGEGIQIIFHNIKVTVGKLAKTFKKVFSWQKFIDDIRDYGNLFSEFFGHFNLNEERAVKLENALSGVWSVIDLLRKAIKILITAGLKVLGPVLEVLYDIFLDITSVVGSAITKFNEWTDEHSFLTDAITWFGETLKSVIETVRTFFTELWNLPAVQQIKENLLDLGETIIDKLAPYFEEAGEKIKEFFGKFDDEDGSGMQRVLDGINSALEKIIDFSGDASDAIGDFTGKVSGGISSLLGFKTEAEDVNKNLSSVKKTGEKLSKSNSLGEFFTNLTDLVGKFGFGVDNVVDWVIKKFNSIDGATVALVGFGTSISAFGLGLSYLSYNVGNFVKTLTTVPLEISNTIKSFRGVFDGIKTYLSNKSQAEVIKSFAIAIAVLAGSLFLLTNFTDIDNLERVTICLEALLAVVTAAVAIIVLVSKKMSSSKNFFKSMSALAVMFVAIAAAAFILTMALTKLTEIKWNKDIIAPCIALVVIIGALVGLSALFTKLGGEFSKAALNVVFIAAGVYLVAVAMKKLNDVDTEGIWTKIGALISILTVLGLVALLMSQFSFSNAIGLLTLIGSIYLVELALYAILVFGVSMDDIIEHIDKFLPILIALGVIATFMITVGFACKEASNVAVNIIATAASIYIIVRAIKFIGEQDLGTIIKGTATVLVLLIAIQYMLKALAKGGTYTNNAGTTLLKMAVAIGLLAVVVALIGKVPFKEAQKGVLIVLELMTMVTLFALLTSKTQAMDFKALYAIVVAIGVMSVAVALLAKIEDKMALLQAAGILGLTLIALGTSLYLASRWANKLKTSALVAMIIALVVIASSLYLLAKYAEKQSMLITAASCMAGVLLALGGTFAIFGKTFNSLGTKSLTKNGRLTAMILMITMLAAVAAALYFLSKSTSESIIASALAIAGVMFFVLEFIGNFFTKLSVMKLSTDVLIGFGLAIVLLAAVAGSLALLLHAGGESDWTQYLAAAMAISTVMIVVVGILQYINKASGQFNLSTLGAVVSACALLLVVSYSLKQVLGTGADWSQMLAAAGAMAGAIIAISFAVGLLIALTSTFGGVGVAAAAVILFGLSAVLLTLATAFTAFGKASKNVVSALRQLTKVDFDILKANLGTLWQLVAIAGALSIIASILGVGLVAVGVGLAAVGVGAIPVVAGLAIVGVTIAVVSKAVTALVEAFNTLVTTFSTSNGSIKSGITEIGEGLAGAITGFVTTLAVNAPVIKASMLMILNTLIDIIVEGITTINDKILDGIIDFLTSLDNKLPEITERINSIITTLLSSIAQNAQTYGYYGAVIAISFLYGVSEGFVEYSDELGQTVANVIVAIFNMMSTLIDTLLPILSEGIGDGVLDLSEKLWGVLAKTGWDYAEENLETIHGEQEQRAAEKSEKIGAIVDESMANSIEDNGEQVSDATQTVVENATDQTDTAQKGATSTGTGFIDGLKNQVTSGFSNMDITSIFGENVGNVDLSSFGISAGETYTEAAEAKIESMDVSGLPASVKQQMKEEGWQFVGTGETMMAKVQEGVDNSTVDMSSYTDDIQSQIYDSADDTAEGMTEKGTITGENYGTGIATGIDNTVEQAKESAENLANTVNDTVNITLEINSPSKKAKEAGQYYGMGLAHGIKNMTNYVAKASTDLAHQTILAVGDMMATISDVMSDGSVDWTPTITPVIDSSNIQNGINLLGNVGSNSLAMAADASVSVDNASQSSLANQVQALSQQVQRLADTDYSHMMDGVAINVDASTNVDGTPLRRMSSAYTIKQINDTQNGIIMAAGGRV